MFSSTNLVLATLLASLAPLAAQVPVERPLAAHVPLATVWRADQPRLEVPVADTPQSVTVQLPALPAPEGSVLCLRFQALLYTKSPAGWNNFLGLKWNDAPLEQDTAAHLPRVLNRRASVETTHPTEARFPVYRSRSGLPCLVTFFGPDFDTLDERVIAPRDEGCWFLLDISDVARADQPNKLELVNTALAQYWGGNPPPDLRLIVGNLEIGSVDAKVVESLRGALLEKRELIAAPAVELRGTKVSIVPGGGIQLQRGGEAYFVETRLRVGGKDDWLRCSAAPFGSTPKWRPTCRRAGDASWEVAAEHPAYRLDRRVEVSGGRISVRDMLTNRTSQPLGVVYHHQVIVPRPPREYRLGGVQRRSVSPFRSPENPTLFLAQEASGLGLVTEDDVLRLQLESLVEANLARAGTTHFALDAGRSYTFEWALYPGPADYFAFINAVRRDWRVNFTVLGPFDFVPAGEYQTAADQGKLRSYLARKKLMLFALSPWFEYYSGYSLSREQYKDLMQKAMGVIKSLQPEAKCLALTETNLAPVPLSFFQGKLPPDFGWGRGNGGVYGKPAPPEAAQAIENSPWADSVIRGPDGAPLLDTWYVGHYKEPRGLNLMVFPTLTNYRHRLMLDQLHFLLDEVGFDGVYIDQFSLGYGTKDHFTHGRWDGHTVDLDLKTGAIQRRYSDLSLISAPARRAWCEYALSRNKVVVANSMPTVRELQSLPVMRFMETQGYDPISGAIPDQPRCAKGQLASPIGLGHSWGYGRGSKPRGGEFLMRTVIAHLRYGLLYYYYGANVPAEGEAAGGYGPVNHMFPFTPVELHRGWLLGKERTITCISGTFPWLGTGEPQVHLFDSVGRERPAAPKIEQEGGRLTVKIALRDWHEVAVIE